MNSSGVDWPTEDFVLPGKRERQGREPLIAQVTPRLNVNEPSVGVILLTSQSLTRDAGACGSTE
jgi:hypothetical protein